MAVMLAPAALLLAALAVALLGFAAQRGATCTVAAVAEILDERRARRLLALLEAAAWVSGGIVITRALGLTMATPVDHPLTTGVLAGGALLGLGAVIAGACAFGAVARLGSGEWAFAALPLGYLAGCLLAVRLGLMPPPSALATTAPVAVAPGWLALPLLIIAAVRLIWVGRRGGWTLLRPPGPPWHPHAATIVMALAFVFVMFFAGPWAYTEALWGLAHGEAGSVVSQLLLFAALVGGSMLGARHTGRLGHHWAGWRAALRCFAGGLVMAMGSLLIPGSNDALILIGLPNFQPYAWAAMAAMVASIAVALTVQTRLQTAPLSRS